MQTIKNLIQNAQPYWQQYTEHLFVQQLAAGTLPIACFQHYLKQDYRFLFQYSRAISLGILKAKNFSDIFFAQAMNAGILSEIELHIAYCQQWGISERDLFATEESAACIAYTRYVLDCGQTGGLAELYTALAPCAIGYAEIAKQIAPLSVPNNPYQTWIDAYRCDEFQQSSQSLADYLNTCYQTLTPQQFASLQTLFNTATRMEANFWQMGLEIT